MFSTTGKHEGPIAPEYQGYVQYTSILKLMALYDYCQYFSSFALDILKFYS